MRKPRVQYPGALYHVMVRGNQSQKTFLAPEDYKKYLVLLSERIERADLILYAYCLMPNHVHLLVEQGGHQGLSRAMQRLQTTYTSFFNRKYKKWGHLFQGRYKAILVDKDSYLLELVRYIHLNPYRAKLEERLGIYPWTGHRQYLGREKEPLVKVARAKILPMLSNKPKEAIGKYAKFVRDGMGQGHQEGMYEAGGWQILGSEEFKFNALAKVGKNKKEIPFKLKLAISAMWDKTKEREELSDEPEGWRRSRLMAEVSYLLMEYGDATGRELGEFFEVDGSAISQARRRLEKRWEGEPESGEKLVRWARGL